MDQQMTHKEQLEWWIEWYRQAPSVARPYGWACVDMASGQVVTKVGARGPIHAVAGQGGDTITRFLANDRPKPLPNGATRHKALPAACLEPLDDRAAFIGRWEQKIV